MTTATKYQTYPKYKPSGIDWLGDIPEGWEAKRLRFVLNTVGGNGFPEELQGKYEGDYPFYKVSDINSDGLYLESSNNYVDREDILKNKWKIISKDSIVTAKIGAALSLNHRKITKLDGLIDNNMLGLSLKSEEYNLMYVYYLFKLIDLDWFVNPGAVPSVNIDQFIDTFLPLPSLLEQRTIVDFLDRETARIDEVIEKKQKLIELLLEKRQAIISQAVTKGLNPEAKMKDSGIPWLGGIPENWKIKRLKYITRFNYGESLSEDNRFYTGDIEVFGSNGIVGNHNTSLTDGNTIIIGRKGSYGQVKWSSKGCFPIDTTYYIDKRTTNNNLRWLYYLLQLLKLEEGSQDSAVPGLSRESAYEKISPLPEKLEQELIADYLDQKTKEIDELIKKIEMQNQKLQEFRQALISNVVTGKVRVI